MSGPGMGPPRAQRRGLSAAARIHRDLRCEIVSLARRPGEPIVEAEIARAYGVSRTPAREAILQLAHEGLIDIFPQSGTYVSPIPVEDLAQSIELRRVLEEAVVRRAALRVGDADLERLRDELRRQAACETCADHAGFHASDERFHEILSECADRRQFWQVVLQFKTQVDRFRRSTLPVAGRMGHVVAEHGAIVDALAVHDGDGAALAMTLHLDALLAAVEGSRAAHPDWFEQDGA